MRRRSGSRGLSRKDYILWSGAGRSGSAAGAAIRGLWTYRWRCIGADPRLTSLSAQLRDPFELMASDLAPGVELERLAVRVLRVVQFADLDLEEALLAPRGAQRAAVVALGEHRV